MIVALRAKSICSFASLVQTNLGTESVGNAVTKRSDGFGFTNLDHSRSHDREACFNRTNSCSIELSYRTGAHILWVGAEKRLHPVWIKQKRVLHQNDTHLDQARKQLHSINAHKNSEQ